MASDTNSLKGPPQIQKLKIFGTGKGFTVEVEEALHERAEWSRLYTLERLSKHDADTAQEAMEKIIDDWAGKQDWHRVLLARHRKEFPRDYVQTLLPVLDPNTLNKFIPELLRYRQAYRDYTAVHAKVSARLAKTIDYTGNKFVLSEPPSADPKSRTRQFSEVDQIPAKDSGSSLASGYQQSSQIRLQLERKVPARNSTPDLHGYFRGYDRALVQHGAQSPARDSASTAASAAGPSSQFHVQHEDEHLYSSAIHQASPALIQSGAQGSTAVSASTPATASQPNGEMSKTARFKRTISRKLGLHTLKKKRLSRRGLRDN